ncbi:hypothetical protein EWM62_11255 [Mucilaginibacter terrigena]|uniref:Uncharacterized protein n=1 Tax=Mucilaginibacter terrigena TaxID=2492395 RepID=A0A4Q5LMA9_9SPHI|nr:hypothetical protein [Mucilaginibacter terrigena]RYU90112.1 hypothetical protein EWM62_11255 [Mucilaginibacter terrigena]
MKKLLLVIFTMVLLPCLLLGQNRKRLPKPPPLPPTKEENILAEKHNKCFNSHEYSAIKRRSFFPFGNASSIKLISFKAYNYPNPPVYNEEGKDADTVENDRMQLLTPVTKDRYYLNLKKVKEIKQVSRAGIDLLTDILFNIGYTPVKKLDLEIADPGAKCYEPRNAVLFLDGKGNITQYLEICFECRHHYWSSSKVGYIEYCEDKYELLRRYFLAQGIKYGADPKTINNN